VTDALLIQISGRDVVMTHNQQFVSGQVTSEAAYPLLISLFGEYGNYVVVILVIFDNKVNAVSIKYLDEVNHLS
jgi:hypothetical protein